MTPTLQQKLSYIIIELAALRETYKDEIAAIPQHRSNSTTNCHDDLFNAQQDLEDAMYEIVNVEEDDCEEGDSLAEHQSFELRALRVT